MANKKSAKITERVSLVLAEEEADYLINGARQLDISVNQFARSILFPSSFSNALDRKVFAAISEVTKIPKEVSLRLKMQAHTILEYDGRKYVYFDRYQYVFLQEDSVYYPIAQKVPGKSDPLVSLYLIAVSCQNVGDSIPSKHFDIMENLGMIEEPDYGNVEAYNADALRWKIEKTIILRKWSSNYLIEKLS